VLATDISKNLGVADQWERYISKTGYQQIENRMLELGPGSRGVVWARHYGPGPDHVFNVANQGGTVRFLDGQIGKPAIINGWDSFRLLITNWR
jgi:filamentous hemagglutinin